MMHSYFNTESGECDDENDPDFQFSLGLKFSDERAMAAAVKSFRLAAEQGHADAQFHLGALYAQGHEGAPKDFSEANVWFRRAAVRGHQLAVESSEYLERYILPTSSARERKVDTFASGSEIASDMRT